jgi:hypothetical protein
MCGAITTAEAIVASKAIESLFMQNWPPLKDLDGILREKVDSQQND